MPDNQKAGILEDFLATLIPSDDPCWPYANEAAAEARKRGALFPDKDSPKARIHTWLAWQEMPGRPFGLALTAKYFGHDSAEALAFLNWFNRLFGA